MINVAVCDDDLDYAMKMETLLLRISRCHLIEMNVEVYSDGLELWDSLLKGQRFQLVYLDIKMAKLDGINVARKIREKDIETIIIYISSYEDYFIELFEVEPFRFIKKPVDTGIFTDYFLKAYERIIKDAYFIYYFRKKPCKRKISSITYFESVGRIVLIHSTDVDGKFYGKLSDLEEQMAEWEIPFLRIHQSYLVNYRHICQITFGKVTLLNGIELQISDDRKRLVRERYTNLLEREVLSG